ncbi:hypothetical protein BKA58DRAFT_142789 [Alternaria rosae]|uniref:uncharacterized protein n=1 Tax=Alternaria rosae TaxID=1187941 RepID=UPI001E8D26B8|nr:uncharacterized protein BKA58DRAFT_142789 [Alternaria rosae]KAH6872294.1 hypothetical protein BKA58DRAFT_142789 [Alternaria rosae]
MENNTTEPYRDSPARARRTSSTHQASPSSSDSSATIKPLSATPPPYADEEPYHDDPPTPTEATPSTRQTTSPTHQRQSRRSPAYQPYTDSPPHTPDADDVPLALLVSHTYTQSTEISHQSDDAFYPADAPPPYAIAVRQSYRDTLVQYIPRGQHASREEDEESQLGADVARPDDVRHSVENIVAMFVVAILLLVLSGVLAWLAFGSGLVG